MNAGNSDVNDNEDPWNEIYTEIHKTIYTHFRALVDNSMKLTDVVILCKYVIFQIFYC